jgi:hypothetical protein
VQNRSLCEEVRPIASLGISCSEVEPARGSPHLVIRMALIYRTINSDQSSEAYRKLLAYGRAGRPTHRAFCVEWDPSARFNPYQRPFFGSSNWVISTVPSGNLAVIFSSPPRALTKSWRVLTYISARRSGSLPQGLKSVRENWVVPPGLRSFFPLFPALEALG